jgi:predicted glycogen debranching enzyme
VKADRKRKLDWRGPSDGPWPWVVVGGELERSENEWLTTNDLGAYASSTVALMHTRRNHGLLVVPWGVAGPRYVILSHLEVTLFAGGRSYRLSTHQFPGVAPTPGYRYLESFHQDPIPRWVYRFPTGSIERTVSMVRGHRAVCLGFTWSGSESARISLRPLMPMRREYELSHEHGGMLQEVTLRAGEVEVRPISALPSVRFRHSGVFMGSPDWWRQFEYLDDRERFVEFREDMWSPGVFEIPLIPQQTAYLLAFVGDVPQGPPSTLVLEAAEHELSQDPGPTAPAALRALSVAVDSFALASGRGIVAGYPWHEIWVRDLLLAIPGAYLCRDRALEGLLNLSRVFSALKDGLAPERLDVEGPSRLCLDASLWLFLASQKVLQALDGPTRALCLEELVQNLARVFEAVCRGAGNSGIHLSEQGLLAVLGRGPATWMDAVVGGRPVTPRTGVAVEIQALWARACSILADLASEIGDANLAQKASVERDKAHQAFRDHFWNFDQDHPFDRISSERGTLASWGDATIRPGALMALAIAPKLFDDAQAHRIVDVVEARLLTPRGVRTLDPEHPGYVGSAGGSIEERLRAAHQGSAWPHLLLFYVRAKMRIAPSERQQLIGVVEAALSGGRSLGFVPQMVDGDAPHAWRGSPAYAVANALLLEALMNDLRAPVPGERGSIPPHS